LGLIAAIALTLGSSPAGADTPGAGDPEGTAGTSADDGASAGESPTPHPHPSRSGPIQPHPVDSGDIVLVPDDIGEPVPPAPAAEPPVWSGGPEVTRFATSFATVVVPQGTAVSIPVQVDGHPAGDTQKAAVRWTASAAKVATVVRGERQGTVAWRLGHAAQLTVHALKAGRSSITLAAPGAKAHTVTVKVVSKPSRPQRVRLDAPASTLAPGDSTRLVAVVSPAGAARASAVWASANPAVASVDAAGRVTAHAPGKAVITCRVGKVKAKTTVKVG
jgi:hypothetical protein